MTSTKKKHAALKPSFTAAAIAVLMALPGPSLAGPTGGAVVAGSAGITQSGPVTDINQTSNRAVINWQGFSIGSGETVNFNQPSSSAATLNRVIGNETSVISGALNANGQVFIVNSAGVLFSKSAEVNVGGLVASTLNISNANFMSGNYTFNGNSGASIINEGRLHARPGGYIALLGKTVSNDGVINATLGTVAMASGDRITLNFGGDSLVDVTIDKGTLNALVENKRAIVANGGQVIMTAKAADQILSAQVNNSGIIQARTMAALKGGAGGPAGTVHIGKIKLLAQGGTVNVGGTLDASAPHGGDGGTIETSGNTVNVANNAVITTKAASGNDGSWIIDPDGFTIAPTNGDITGAQLSAELGMTSISILSTEGTTTENDGNINVNDVVSWSNGNTLSLTATNSIFVNQNITAPSGGLRLTATNGDADVDAPVQVATLDAMAGGNVNVNAPLVQVATLSAIATNNINIDAAQSWTSGSWKLSGSTININNSVAWSGGTLTLNAANNIYVSAAMTASGSANLSANYGHVLDANGDPTAAVSGTGFNANGTPLGLYTPLTTVGTFAGQIDFSGTGSVVLNGQPYTVINSVAALDSIAGNLSGNYVLGSDLANLSTSDLQTLVFPTANQFTGNFNGFGHSLTLAPVSTMSIDSPLAVTPPANTNVVLVSNGDININAPVTSTSAAGVLTFNAVNDINLNALVTGLGDNGSIAFNADNALVTNQSMAVSAPNIFINGPAQWTGNTTLTATNEIDINAAMSEPGTANFTATAANNVNINALQNWTTTGSWTFSGTNINVNNTVNWSAGTLTLNAGAAGGFINLNAMMSATNSASLVMNWDTGFDTSTVSVTAASSGFPTTTYTEPSSTYGTPFGGLNPLYNSMNGMFAGSINFTNTTAANPLTINGNPYTLITSMAQLAGISGITGNYALARSLDASTTPYLGFGYIVSDLSGTFEGLGNNINGLNISSSSHTVSGALFGSNSGTIRDLSLTNESISVAGGDTGGLVGTNSDFAQILNTAVSGTVTYTAQSNGSSFWGPGTIGGLVGENEGIIYGSTTNVTVTTTNADEVGGLVGLNFVGTPPNIGEGIILDSSATGPVNYTLNNLNATGATFTAGGLVGSNGGFINGSSASGLVTGSATVAGAQISGLGGLVGTNQPTYNAFGAAINNSVSTSNVAYSGNSNGVVGVGGFAGISGLGASISNSSASGSISLQGGISATTARADTFIGTDGTKRSTINNTTLSNDTFNTPPGSNVENTTGVADIGVTTGTGFATTGAVSGVNSTTATATLVGGPSTSGAQTAAAAVANAQTLTQAATAQQNAVAQAAAAAQAAAQAAAAKAAAAQDAARIGDSIATVDTETSSTNPPNPSNATAGQREIDALAFPDIEDNLTSGAAGQGQGQGTGTSGQGGHHRLAVTTTHRRHRGNNGGGFGASIRGIDVNGKHFNLQNSPGQ